MLIPPRIPVLLFTAALCLGLPACTAREPGAEQALKRLEHMAFVPADRALLETILVRTVLYENPQPLLVERFEVTRGEWREFADARPDDVGQLLHASMREWLPEGDDRPASFMTFEEASAYAAWRGMRLPSSSEWLFLALGRERRQYPWDVYERRDSVANTLELGLERTCAVGTFEGGRTPSGLYDVLGNVAEWVSDDVETRGALRTRSGEPRTLSALGGSFRSWNRPILRLGGAGDSGDRPYLAYRLDAGSRQDDVGLRCVVSAADFLWEQARLWPDDRAGRARLTALGQQWGRAAQPLLAELAARPGAPPGLALLRDGAAP